MKEHEAENTQAFTPEDLEKGLFEPFLSALLAIQSKAKYPLDIRIWSDGYCRVVSWASAYDESRYELVEEGQFVDEWINGDNGDAYRKTDLEDPAFCAQSGIIYDKETRHWRKADDAEQKGNDGK